MLTWYIISHPLDHNFACSIESWIFTEMILKKIIVTVSFFVYHIF